MNKPDIGLVGDATIVVRFEPRIDPLVNDRVLRLAERIRAAQLLGVRDIVPTFCSLAVFFDPLRTPFDALVERLEAEAGRDDAGEATTRPVLKVPVCYDAAYGPDLEQVAAYAGLPVPEVIAMHTRDTYRVFMLGFLPGFAYMGQVDPGLAVPRHSTPRLKVAWGSVGIAGRQTGVYASDSPGGWQIIGRTPIRTFEPARPSPFFFQAGDLVRFVAISPAEYHSWRGESPDSIVARADQATGVRL